MLEKEGKKDTGGGRRRGERPAPGFITDKDGHYDIDGVSYSQTRRAVIVASDADDGRSHAPAALRSRFKRVNSS